MSKAKTATKQTAEEAEFLAQVQAKRAASKSTMPKMKQLAINLDPTDAEGKDAPIGAWYIRGETGYSRTISFTPIEYRSKFIRMSKQGKVWKTDNESIMVSGFEPAYDMKGTTACGRLVGRLPDHWTEVQKQENFKKATCYGMLFGFAKFDDKEPVLVNFRAAPAKAKVIREAISPKSLGADFGELWFYDFTMKLSPEAGTIHPTFEMTPLNVGKPNTSFASIIPQIEEVSAFIEAHNKRIMENRGRFEENVKASGSFKEVVDLAKDFEEDEIPFGG